MHIFYQDNYDIITSVSYWVEQISVLSNMGKYSPEIILKSQEKRHEKQNFRNIPYHRPDIHKRMQLHILNPPDRYWA
jgi:hypothetical protein